jgi:hypothetical protein
MAFWIVFAFVLGLAVGAGVTWWLFGGPTIPSSPSSPSRPTMEPAEEISDSMSLTAKRLVSDLERKYEGAVAGPDEDAARPKKPRAKRVRKPVGEEPADPA